MKKILFLLLTFTMLLGGCSKIQESVDNNQTDTEEIVAGSNASDSYRTLVSNTGTSVRDQFYAQFKSNEEDFYKIGKGLEHCALDYFSTDTYYLKECEHLTYRIGTEATGDYWQLMGKPENYEHSIQPYQDDVNDGVTGPHIYSFLYAVDFYTSSGDGYAFGGMAISIIIYSDYTDNETGITYTYSNDTINKYAKQAVNGIYDYYYNYSGYEECQSVPILIAVYQQASSTNVNSGRYIYCACGQNGSIEDLKAVNQHTYVFTSDTASSADSTTYSEFVLLRSKLKEAGVDAVGVVGIAQYYDGKIDSMTIDVNINSKVYDEFKAMCQYVCQLLNDGAFSEEFELKVKINDQTRTQAVVIKDRDASAEYYMLQS